MKILMKLALFILVSCSTNKLQVDDKQLKEILSLHQKNGGSTYCFHLEGNMNKTPFFAIGIYPEKGLVLKEEPSLKDLKSFLKTHSSHFQDKLCLGTWQSKKLLHYVDLVKVLPREEGVKKAISEARDHKQIAIYDLKTGETINIPEHKNEPKRGAQ